MRPAVERDIPAVWSAVRMAGTFPSRERLERFWSEAPWRVQVSDAGDAAILVRWREHLPLLSIKGLWCGLRQMPSILGQLHDVACAQGFDDLLSPITPEERCEPYLSAGMQLVHTGIAMRLDHVHDPGSATPGPDISLRRAVPGDLESLLAVDKQCFNDFWRYDRPLMEEYLGSERAVVATVDDAVIGYTLSTIDRGDGMLGRLAVLPDRRRRGVGDVLVADVLGFQYRNGARSVALYTQKENETARALYEKHGFRAVGTPQCFLAFGETVAR